MMVMVMMMMMMMMMQYMQDLDRVLKGPGKAAAIIDELFADDAKVRHCLASKSGH